MDGVGSYEVGSNVVMKIWIFFVGAIICVVDGVKVVPVVESVGVVEGVVRQVS